MKGVLIILFFSGLLLISAAGFAQTNNSGTVINIRAGKSIELNASSANAFSFQWFKNGIAIPNATNAKINATESGDYTVLSFNALNCNSALSQKITVIVWPALQNSSDLTITKAAENKAVNINEIFTYTISVENKGPDMAYNVIVRDSLPRQVQIEEIRYNLIASSKYNGQSHTITWKIDSLEVDAKIDLNFSAKSLYPGELVNIATVGANDTDPNPSNNTANAIKHFYGLKFPNVFTPNNDNINDTYKIAGLESFPENEFTVLNRWGNHVYEKKSYENNWTGEGLNEGTYFYVLKIKDSSGKWEVFKGFITLIRTKP